MKGLILHTLPMKRTQGNLMEMQEKKEPVSVSITNGIVRCDRN